MLFWIAIAIESIVMIYFLISALQVRNKYVPDAYLDAYKETLFPGMVLFVIVSSALVVRLCFKRAVASFYIAVSPAVLIVVVLIVWLVVISVRRDPWR